MIKRVSIIILVLLFTSAKMAEAKNKNLILAGNILQVALPVTAYAMTKIHDDDEGSKQFWTSFIITNGVVHAIKISTGRTKLGKRPNGKANSFPSGHTGSAFQGAMFIQHRYGATYGLPAIGLAALTGYSRVHGKYHHVRDVVAGAAIASIASYYTVDKFGEANVRISVGASKGGALFSLSLQL